MMRDHARHGLPHWCRRGSGGDWVRIPALGDLIGLAFLQVFGVGYCTIEQALHNTLPRQIMALLVVIKVIATSVTIGSGGAFIPSLLLGAMLGGCFGTVATFDMPVIHALGQRCKPCGAQGLTGCS